MRIVAKVIAVVTAFTLLGSSSVFAAPPRFTELDVIFTNGLTAAVSFGSLVAVGMTVFAGYTYMTSAGDPQKVQRAQGTITWVIVGIIFLSISGFIIIALIDFFSIP